MSEKVYTAMTPDDRKAAAAVMRCRCGAFSPDRRFQRQLHGITNAAEPEITDGQRLYLWRLVERYRAQIGDVGLVHKAGRTIKRLEGKVDLAADSGGESSA